MATVEDLLEALDRLGLTDGGTLARTLGVSAPTLGRLVQRAQGRVVRLGRTRGARYARARELPGLGAALPVHRISEDGRVVSEGTLHVLARGTYWHRPSGGESRRYEGLPPWAVDMSPQGYLGRDFATRHPELGLPHRLADWNDDHRLVALARRGEDCVGDLVLGSESLDRWLASRLQPVVPADYPGLARASAAGELGSSAAGEHPKFPAFTRGRHCLVKFAGGDESEASVRWRDLLLCEHLALETLSAHDVPAAASSIVDVGPLRFLEVERFDRVGARGRRGVLSLFAIDDEYVGEGTSWTRLAPALLKEKLCRPEDAHRLLWLDVFGQLTANTDRHLGNISFFTADDGELRLCPVYDPPPMLFAPTQTSVIERAYVPKGPTVDTLAVWRDAANAAMDFWQRAARDTRLSPAMQARVAEASQALAALRAAAPV